MSTATVLILTAEEDETATAVQEALRHRGTRVVRLDTGDFPVSMSLTARHDGQAWASSLATAGGVVNLADVGAVYYRRPTSFRLPEGVSSGDAVFAVVEARLGLGGIIHGLDATWVNHPAHVAMAEFKPIGLQTAPRVGLTVPRTLITNDHGSLLAFAEEVDGPLVCKPLSSLVLSHDDVPRAVFTTPIDPAAVDPAALAVTTHLIQEWVPKAYEVRVTMVGHRPYATAIRSSSEKGRIDWRSDYESLTYQTIDPPADVVAGMIGYLDVLRLNYGAFDFIVTPDGRWVMLECNPAGQWLWLEEEAGLPIAAGLADLLTEGKHE